MIFTIHLMIIVIIPLFRKTENKGIKKTILHVPLCEEHKLLSFENRMHSDVLCKE